MESRLSCCEEYFLGKPCRFNSDIHVFRDCNTKLLQIHGLRAGNVLRALGACYSSKFGLRALKHAVKQSPTHLESCASLVALYTFPCVRVRNQRLYAALLPQHVFAVAYLMHAEIRAKLESPLVRVSFNIVIFQYLACRNMTIG